MVTVFYRAAVVDKERENPSRLYKVSMFGEGFTFKLNKLNVMINEIILIN